MTLCSAYGVQAGLPHGVSYMAEQLLVEKPGR